MNRKIERLELGNWVECEMQDLTPEDIFRFLDSKGVWIVNGTLYFKDGTWGVACEPIEG